MNDTKIFEILHTDNLQKQEDSKTQTLCYEQEGYEVHVYFSGNKTLAQCIRNLIERE